jgi:hypothetical protein
MHDREKRQKWQRPTLETRCLQAQLGRRKRHLRYWVPRTASW